MFNSYKLTFTKLIILLLFVSCKESKPQKESLSKNNKPNIVYILADDLGYAEIGSYGQKHIKTPNLDALAKQGVLFTDHYSGSPVCAPSRFSLLTGLHTGHGYIRGNDEWPSRGDVWDYKKSIENIKLEGQRPIPDSTFTIGKMLQKNGYKTALVGKWGLGAPNTGGVANKQGFDYFYGYNCQRQAHNLYPKHLWKNEERVYLNNDIVVPHNEDLAPGADINDSSNYSKFTQNDYAPELMLNEALGFIDSNKENPFFLYFASPLPHLPLQAPKEYVDRYRKVFGEEKPYPGRDKYFPNQYPRATYAAMVTYLDDQVGEIIAKLKKLGLYENTLIVFSSDNGPTFLGGADSKFFDSAKPFNSEKGKGKCFVYEGGVRVPMIASWPNKIKQNTKSNHVSAQWDVLATLADVIGDKNIKKTDGISFLPTLLNKEQKETHEYLFWEFTNYGGQQALRKGNWKVVRQNMEEGSQKIELYDLSSDYETTDVADKYPEIVKEMDKLLKEAHQEAENDKFKFLSLGETLKEERKEIKGEIK